MQYGQDGRGNSRKGRGHGEDNEDIQAVRNGSPCN